MNDLIAFDDETPQKIKKSLNILSLTTIAAWWTGASLDLSRLPGLSTTSGIIENQTALFILGVFCIFYAARLLFMRSWHNPFLAFVTARETEPKSLQLQDPTPHLIRIQKSISLLSRDLQNLENKEIPDLKKEVILIERHFGQTCLLTQKTIESIEKIRLDESTIAKKLLELINDDISTADLRAIPTLVDDAVLEAIGRTTSNLSLMLQATNQSSLTENSIQEKIKRINATVDQFNISEIREKIVDAYADIIEASSDIKSFNLKKRKDLQIFNYLVPSTLALFAIAVSVGIPLFKSTVSTGGEILARYFS